MTTVTSLSGLYSKTKKLQLHNPSDADDLMLRQDGTPIEIEMVGPHSATAKEAFVERGRQLTALGEVDPDESAKELIELECLAKMVVGWNADEIFGEYSEARVLELLSDRELGWFTKQIERFFVSTDFFND